MRILQWSGYFGRGRDRNGPDEASGQPDVAAEDEATPLGTSQYFGPELAEPLNATLYPPPQSYFLFHRLLIV